MPNSYQFRKSAHHRISFVVKLCFSYPDAVFKLSHSKSLQTEESDTYLVLSFIDKTLVLGIGETVEEVKDSGFLEDVPTLSASRIGDDSLLQVIFLWSMLYLCFVLFFKFNPTSLSASINFNFSVENVYLLKRGSLHFFKLAIYSKKRTGSKLRVITSMNLDLPLPGKSCCFS